MFCKAVRIYYCLLERENNKDSKVFYNQRVINLPATIYQKDIVDMFYVRIFNENFSYTSTHV